MNTFQPGDAVCQIGNKERLTVIKRMGDFLVCERSDGTRVQEHYSKFEHYDPVQHQ